MVEEGLGLWEKSSICNPYFLIDSHPWIRKIPTQSRGQQTMHDIHSDIYGTVIRYISPYFSFVCHSAKILSIPTTCTLFCLFSCDLGDVNIFCGSTSLQWRHYGHDGASNHQPHLCLFNRLFGRRSKKASKLLVTGLCVGTSLVTGEFPAQMARNAKKASIWWRHHVAWLPQCRTVN